MSCRGRLVVLSAVLGLIFPAFVATTPAVAAATSSATASAANANEDETPTAGTAAPRPKFAIAPWARPVKAAEPSSAPQVHGYDPRYSQMVDDGSTTPTRAFYVNADGSGSLILSAAPVRFKGSDGSWHPIDLSLVPDSDGSLRPRSAPNLPRIRVADGEPELAFPTDAGPIVLRHEDAKLDLARPLAMVARKGSPSGSAAAVAAITKASAKMKTASGVDVRYDVHLTSVNDDLVLPSAASGSIFTLSVSMPPGVTARQGADGVEFVDSTGTVLMTDANGQAFDESATTALGDVGPPGSSTPVSVTLVRQSKG